MRKKVVKQDIAKKLAETQEALKRALADYQNLERRTAQEKEAVVKFASTIFIVKILPILDGLEKAAQFQKDTGISMIVQKLQAILAEENVKEIAALGEKFDPAKMEAVEVVRGEDDKVVGVVRKGYETSGKVLRPAMVKVGKTKIEGSQENVKQFGDYA